MRLTAEDRAAIWVACASFAVLMFKATVLDTISAPVAVFPKLGSVVEGAVASLLAGSLFFLVVNNLSARKDRTLFRPWVREKLQFIAGQFDAFINELSKHTGIAADPQKLDDQTITKMLSAVTPASAAPLLVALPSTYANWYAFLKHHLDRANAAVSDLMVRNRMLDGPVLMALTQFEQLSLHKLLHTILLTGPVRNNDLSHLAGQVATLRDKVAEIRTISAEL